MVVPSPATSFVLLATSWTSLQEEGGVSEGQVGVGRRASGWVGASLPSAEVLELVLEHNRLGHSHTICRVRLAWRMSALLLRVSGFLVADDRCLLIVSEGRREGGKRELALPPPRPSLHLTHRAFFDRTSRWTYPW